MHMCKCACRSVTAGELGVGAGWGAGQHMWYMAQLNQFLVQMLLPSEPHASKQVDPILAAVDMLAHQADTETLPQRARQLLEHRPAALGLPKGQDQRAHLQGERQPHKALLQDAVDAVIRDQNTSLLQAETVVPLADEVGELYMYTADDLKAIAPLWWNYTKTMRVFHETHAAVC